MTTEPSIKSWTSIPVSDVYIKLPKEDIFNISEKTDDRIAQNTAREALKLALWHAHCLKVAGCLNAHSLISATIEILIDLLDDLSGDADLEPCECDEYDGRDLYKYHSVAEVTRAEPL